MDLTIELVSGDHYAEVKRQFYLPFVPFEGLKMELDLVRETSGEQPA